MEYYRFLLRVIGLWNRKEDEIKEENFLMDNSGKDMVEINDIIMNDIMELRVDDEIMSEHKKEKKVKVKRRLLIEVIYLVFIMNPVRRPW